MVLLLGAAACKKTVQCTEGPVEVSITRFDSTEIERLTLYRYAKNGSFTNALDSESVDLHAYRGLIRHDTLYRVIDLGPGFDYRVVAYPLNRIWNITELAYQPAAKEIPNDKDYFFNCPLASYRVNDSLFAYPETVNQAFDVVYLRK
jgi:hypothetical protein